MFRQKRKTNKELSIHQAIAELIILASKIDALTNLSIPKPDIMELEKLSVELCNYESRLPITSEYDSVVREITERIECYLISVGQMRRDEFEHMVGGFW